MPAEPIRSVPAAMPARSPAPLPPAPDEALLVPLGWRPTGVPVLLDLSPGPDGAERHGLIAGATGSGKTELVATIVLGLASAYSAERVNVALVDRYRPGVSIAALARLPHIAAMMTEMDETDALSWIWRMAQALDAEFARRSRLLIASGYRTAIEYRRARHAGAPLAALPTLLVICEEAGDLATIYPPVAETFERAVRFAGPLGVSLLLADSDRAFTQGPLGHLLRSVRTQLNHRIVLRTASTHTSEHLLGTPAAAQLPGPPREGYLRIGDGTPGRFHLAYPLRDRHARPRYLEPYEPDPGPSPLERFAATRAAMEPPTRQIWLPPTPAPPALDELLGPMDEIPGRGLSTSAPGEQGRLSAPVGLADDLRRQCRFPLWLPLHQHLAVVGGPRTGRSTLLRTLAVGLALTHTPDEVTLYCLDLGGGKLTDLARLPHTAQAADSTDPVAVRDTVRAVAATLAEREGSGTQPAGTGSAPDRAPGPRPASQVLLLVDGWETIQDEYPDLELTLLDLIERGATAGLHVAGTASAWATYPANRDAFGCWLELRLDDGKKSALGRSALANLPWGQPGAGLTQDGTPFRTARPEPASRRPGDLLDRIASAWRATTQGAGQPTGSPDAGSGSPGGDGAVGTRATSLP